MWLTSLSSRNGFNSWVWVNRLAKQLCWEFTNSLQIESVENLKGEDDLVELDLTGDTFKNARPTSNSQIRVLVSQVRSLHLYVTVVSEVRSISAVVVSTQHDPDISQADLKEGVMEEIVKPVLPSNWLTSDTKYFINPTGKFVIGGPAGDCGLTGRKIIVDTYGGMARHGGGAFSGKDPSKVDRSAAYAGRYVAKNIVASGLAERCEIQVSYAIGVAEPTSVSVNTFGTSNIPEEEIANLVREHFDLRPRQLINMLDLKRPIYQATAAYGRFGREEDAFTWEKTDKVDALKS